MANRVSTGSFTKNPQHKTPAQAAPEFDPARPGKFDLAGFISGTVKHTNSRIIPVSIRPDLAVQAQELERERARLASRADDDGNPVETSRRRVSAKTPEKARLEEIDAELDRLATELAPTWLDVKVRAMEPSELDKVRSQKMPQGTDLASVIFEMCATVRPANSPDEVEWSEMTAEQWTTLFDTIGIPQYNDLDKAHAEVTYQSVTPDFSERFSRYQATRSTSSS